MPGSSGGSWGSAGSEEFHLIDVNELPAEPQEQPQRRTGRLARLLGRGPWRRAAAAAAAAPQPAGASAHLEPIPIVSLAHSSGGCTAVPQLSSEPSGAEDTPQAGSTSLGEATVGTWLQHSQPCWGLPPSHDGSLCSGISVCSASQAGGDSSSSAAHSRGSSCSWPLEGPGGQGGQDCGSSVHSSSSRLLNLLMLQAEAGAVGAADTRPLPAAAAAQLDCTPNPLLQQEQAALLSWRRHAWHAAEQRQPELLRRLLSPGWGDEQAAAEDAPCGAAAVNPLTSSGMAAAASRPGKQPAFGKPTFGRLLAVIAVLAVAVLVLHAAHSDAAHRKLTEPRGGLVVYGDLVGAGGDVAATAPGAGGLLGGGVPLQPALLGPSSQGRLAFVDDQGAVAQRLPRRRLRLRRIVLLIEWE